MWIPRSEKEIVDAITSGSLQETSTFDAKKEPPSKNQEIAKDIAAMTCDGGVIIYGIDEDENKRLSILNPISLAGQSERIDAIVRSSISEPPQICITSIPTETNPSIGYLIVFVPPSGRAPHMVIVKDDNRFYGRSATGNIILTEGQVARLYARREQTEVDRDQLLDNEIKSWPTQPNTKFSYLYLFARPVIKGGELFGPLKTDLNLVEAELNNLLRASFSETIYKDGLISPDFTIPNHWERGSSALIGHLGYETRNPSDQPGATLDLRIDFDGTGHLFSGRAGEKLEDGFVHIFPNAVIGLTSRLLAFIGAFYEKFNYLGMVDIGLGLTGLQGSIIHLPNYYFRELNHPYKEEVYKRTSRCLSANLNEDIEQIVKLLSLNFFNALSQGKFDPFKNKQNNL